MTVCWHKKAQIQIAGETGQSSPNIHHLQLLTKPPWRYFEFGNTPGDCDHRLEPDRTCLSADTPQMPAPETKLCSPPPTDALCFTLAASATSTANCPTASASPPESLLLLTFSQLGKPCRHHLCSITTILSVIASTAPVQAPLMSWQHQLCFKKTVLPFSVSFCIPLL